VRKVARGFRDDPELRTKSIDHVRVTGNSATLIAHSTYEGADVRTKATFTKRPGGAWMLSKDQILDAAAPKAPLVAYESYAAALAKGSSERACALTTMRGRELLANAIAQPHGGSTCEGAIPFLAVAAGQQPEAEVIDGEEAADSAELYALQSIAHRGWAFRVITMKRENGAWRYESSRNLGIAPSVVAPHGPVT
jgi:hypothetical protein